MRPGRISLPSPALLRTLALTVAVGGVGGVLAHWAELPLAWIIGPALAAGVAHFAGLPVNVPTRFRNAVLAVLGTYIGSAFSPETAAQAHRWPLSLAVVVGLIPLATFVLGAWYRRAGRLDPVTAFFGASPGGLGPMILLGGALGGRETLIALLQTIRVVTLVSLAPVLALGLLPDAPPPLPRIGSGAPIGLADAGLLAGGVLTGVAVALVCRVPAPQFTGALLVSAGLHLGGVVAGSPPSWLLALTLVVLGASLGCQFADVRVGGLVRLAAVGLLGTLGLLAVTAAIAGLLSAATGLHFLPLLLAFAPGGVSEMSLIAVAMNIDPAFVAFHHLVRLSVILVVSPHLGRWVAARAARRPRNGA